jgi:1-deoxy-D-xylulose-5-phosphate reductoisomerase
VAALSAHGKLPELVAQAQRFRPRWVVAAEEKLARQFDWSGLPPECELLIGAHGLSQVAALEGVDVVLAAIVGSAGLRSTLAAIEAKKTIALANKETLVMAGSLVTKRAAEQGAAVLPVDSEHSAIFQALRAGKPEEEHKNEL